MKQLAFRILAFIIASVAAAACTQNDGRIGTLFGSWSLTEMTCDGKQVPIPEGATGSTVSFQGEVAIFRLLYGPDYSDNSTCTWTKTEDTVVFNFNHSSGDAPGTGHYAPPSWLGFSEKTITIHITELNDSHFCFGYTSSNGQVYTYKFNRTW